MKLGTKNWHTGEQKPNIIPKSTLCDYISGKVQLGRRQGPQPILSWEEEQCLAQWVTEMEEDVGKAVIDESPETSECEIEENQGTNS